VQAVLNGLNSTNRRNEWGLNGWPWNGVSQTNPFEKWKRYEIEVAFELVNQQGRVIGNQTVKLSPSFKITSGNDKFYVAFDENTSHTVVFNGVRADDISDDLTIRVASVNGRPPQTTRFAINAISAEKRKEYLLWWIEKGVLRGFNRSLPDEQRKQYGDLVIPEEVWGQPVTAIGAGAFANNNLTSITIPSSVTTIRENAFATNQSESQIREITIKANKISIGNNALPQDFIKAYHKNGSRADTYSHHRTPSRTAVGWTFVWVTAAEMERINAEIARINAETEQIAAQREEQRKVGLKKMEYKKAELKKMGYTAKIYETHSHLIDDNTLRREKNPIKFGWRFNTDFAYTSGGTSSNWFDMNYPGHDNIGLSDWDMGGNLGLGLTLNLRILNSIVLATELNYAYMWNEFLYGENNNQDKNDFAVKITTRNHNINVPILLRKGKRMGSYLEFGYQFGFPIISEIKVNTGDRFPYDKINDSKDFSEYRVEKDHGIVFGFGLRGHDANSRHYRSPSLGLRFVYHLTKLDKDGIFKAPFIFGIYYARDFF